MSDKDNPREDPSPTTLAYIAGIIDGEGTIFISKGKPASDRTSPSYVACVRVGMTDRRVIDFLHRSLGVGAIHLRKMTQAKWKNCWMWAVTGRPAGQVLRDIRPYLVLKVEQADLLLEYLDGFVSFELNGRNGVSQQELERRELLRQRIRVLNRKGSPATTEREDTGNGESTV